MSAPTRPIPEAFGSEDGETWWVVGHVDATSMVLAAVFEQMVNVGAQEASDLLIGGAPRYTNDDNRRTLDDIDRDVAALFDAVCHVWLVQDPDDDDAMHSAASGDVGAEAWTRLDL